MYSDTIVIIFVTQGRTTLLKTWKHCGVSYDESRSGLAQNIVHMVETA